jgi:hypothetical protein
MRQIVIIAAGLLRMAAIRLTLVLIGTALFYLSLARFRKTFGMMV